MKYLDGMSDDDVVGLNIPTGIRCSTSWTKTSSRWWPVAGTWTPRRAAGAAAVAAQGAK